MVGLDVKVIADPLHIVFPGLGLTVTEGTKFGLTVIFKVFEFALGVEAQAEFETIKQVTASLFANVELLKVAVVDGEPILEPLIFH